MNTLQLSTINPENEIETKILEIFKWYLIEDPSIHISGIHDDYLDNTKSGTVFEDIEGYGYTEQQLLDFCNKYNIDTDWDTEQQIIN